MKRILIAIFAALIVATALSGCFIEPEPGYDHDRYEHEHHDEHHDYDRDRDYNRY